MLMNFSFQGIKNYETLHEALEDIREGNLLICSFGNTSKSVARWDWGSTLKFESVDSIDLIRYGEHWCIIPIPPITMSNHIPCKCRGCGGEVQFYVDTVGTGAGFQSLEGIIECPTCQIRMNDYLQAPNETSVECGVWLLNTLTMRWNKIMGER